MTTESSPVWFISGCSSGFGRELALLVLARGWRAVVTARNKARVVDLAEGTGGRCLALGLDVTDPLQVAAAVEQAQLQFGRIDVLVNNAGYGYQSSVEEAVDDEIRALFETNVFGLFAMTRAVLPGMRARRCGHVINITSVAGLVGLPGSGYYAASKHAVEGWSDALAAEVRPLGIKVTCVAPGPFRTDFAGRSLRQTPNLMPEYAATAGARLTGTVQSSGKQLGDPVRAAKAMIHIASLVSPPRHLVLGSAGLEMALRTLRARVAEIESWADTGVLTDYPPA